MSDEAIFAYVLVIVLSLFGLWAYYESDVADCTSRGGRIVHIHGGRGGGWFCEERP